MKKGLFFSFSAALLLFGACSSEAPMLPTEISNTSEVPQKFDLNAALKIAEEALGQLDPATRGKERAVGSIEAVRSEITRGSESDTILYLVNYVGDTGFALMDAEGKNGVIYAISPKGHLEFSDSIDNPALAYFFNRVKNEASQPLTRGDIFVTPGQGTTTITGTNVYGPLLSDWISGWECESIPGVGGSNIKGNASTAAVAIAKLLAFYQKKVDIGNVAIDWNQILKNKSKSEKNKLIAAINQASFLKDNKIYPDDEYESKFLLGDEGRSITPNLVEDALTSLFGEAPEYKYNPTNPNLFSNFGVVECLILSTSTTSATGPVIACCHPRNPETESDLAYYQYWIIDLKT